MGDPAPTLTGGHKAPQGSLQGAVRARQETKWIYDQDPKARRKLKGLIKGGGGQQAPKHIQVGALDPVEALGTSPAAPAGEAVEEGCDAVELKLVQTEPPAPGPNPGRGAGR